MHDSMSNLKELQPEVKTKLASQGIRTTTQLLEHTGTQKQCAELAHEVGTTLVAIKELANRADLMRLHGVGGDFSNMLVAAGVCGRRRTATCGSRCSPPRATPSSCPTASRGGPTTRRPTPFTAAPCRSTATAGIACPRLLRRHSGLSKQRSWPPGSLLIGKSIKIPLICL